MPFTAAHPAAVLPLRTFCPQLFIWSALIAGSIAPDSEYFLALRPRTTHGGTLAGSLYFCVPIGFTIFVTFHLLLKRPLTLLLPGAWRSRVWTVANRRFEVSRRLVIMMIASIIIGAWIHQLWDAFTHQSGWGVRLLPGLATTVISIDDYHLTVYRLLQHGSTMLGLTALTIAAIKWAKNQSPVDAPSLKRPWQPILVAILVGVPLLASSAFAIGASTELEGVQYIRQLVGSAAIGVVTFGSVTALLVGAIITMLQDQLTIAFSGRRAGGRRSGSAPRSHAAADARR